MMENITENNAGQPGSPAENSPVSLGKMLSEARERLGMSVMDVASQIKFAPKQIEALEAEDYRHLPEAAFLRGFVRSYAKVLHLDAAILLAALPQAKAAQTEPNPESVAEPYPSAHAMQRQNLVWLGAASLLIVIVVVFAIWNFKTPVQTKAEQVESPVSLPAEIHIDPSQHAPEAPAAAAMAPKPKTPVVAAQSPAPAPAAKTAPSQAVPQNQTTASDVQPDTPITSLHLVFYEESWSEIKDRDGKILSSKVNPSGSELRLQGRAPFSMLIGHASSVTLYYQGKQIDMTPYTNASSDVARFTLQ
jgi:cytoskeleton protein RodZ